MSGVAQAKQLLLKLSPPSPLHFACQQRSHWQERPAHDETYVLSENLFAAAEVTGDRQYYDLAVHYLLNREWFDPLAAGQDALPSKDSYSHTIALSSGGKAYLATGEAKYKRALETPGGLWNRNDSRLAVGGRRSSLWSWERANCLRAFRILVAAF
ncbi:MAG: hypothetical protein U0Y68_08510 [Blastocatellia bacterium]